MYIIQNRLDSLRFKNVFLKYYTTSWEISKGKKKNSTHLNNVLKAN